MTKYMDLGNAHDKTHMDLGKTHDNTLMDPSNHYIWGI